MYVSLCTVSHLTKQRRDYVSRNMATSRKRKVSGQPSSFSASSSFLHAERRQRKKRKQKRRRGFKTSSESSESSVLKRRIEKMKDNAASDLIRNLNYIYENTEVYEDKVSNGITEMLAVLKGGTTQCNALKRLSSDPVSPQQVVLQGVLKRVSDFLYNLSHIIRQGRVSPEMLDLLQKCKMFHSYCECPDCASTTTRVYSEPAATHSA